MNKFESLTDFDREIWFEELEEFVPHKIFDAHTHIWSNRYAPAGVSVMETSYDDLDVWTKEVFPGRETGFLLIGMPVAGMDAVNFQTFMAEETQKNPLKLGSTLITPEMTAGFLDELIRKHRFCGLKPYRLFAEDPANCRITDYFPEHLIEVADEHKLCVTMHMAKFDGIADKENLADLKYLTRRYPNVRWILAHCARAFNSFTLEKNIFLLRDMPNISYDLSAVCDPRSFYLLFKHESPERLMFGTDNIIASGVHGKYITWGKGWEYFKGMQVPHCRSNTTLVCYENLRCIKQAADMAALNTADIENIFYGNAAAFFGL